MSCNRQATKIGRTAGLKTGLSALNSQAGSVAGQMANMLGRSATVALSVSNSIEGPKRLDALAPLAAVGALLSGRGKTRLKILNILTAAQVARAGASAMGTGIARLSRLKGEPVRTEFYFKGKPVVRAWPSRLTPALNAGDTLGWPRVSVTFSGGQMVECEGQGWHIGTTVVKTSRGEQRTITHLQSMAVPGTHYYFDRLLKDKEVAGIISGQKGFEPKHTPGFAGQISELEALQPTLARLKKGLIQTHLFWGMRRKKSRDL